MLQRIKSKKGFTLAELLIVVAIIAVLTAIAVPLFVTSLQKAQKAAFEANCDTLRTAGIASILNDKNIDVADLKNGDKFYVTGTFNKGKLDTSSINVEWVRSPGTTDKKSSTIDDWDDASESCPITVEIDVEDVSTAITKNHNAKG